jgi:hypothetical protein
VSLSPRPGVAMSCQVLIQVLIQVFDTVRRSFDAALDPVIPREGLQLV